MSEQQPSALRGGTIVDGTGAAPFRGDILIDHGRIVDIGDIDIPLGTQQVDVDDHVVAPGFIDMHSHSDLALLSEPELTIKVRQGITTEVIGQDGISYAPASERGLTQARELFAPVNGEGNWLDWSWRSVHDFLERYRAVAPNVVYLLPHGTIRFSVVGTDDREATPEEMDAMRARIDEGMRDGAWGLSTGLTYPPGRWTPTQEIIELARVAAEHEGIYVTHLRDYGDGLGDAIEEALEIGRRAGIPVHFSHFHVSGPGRGGRADEFLAPIEAARQQGQRATLDLYPYEAGCTTLAAFLPKWLQAHPISDVLTMLQDSGSRARVIQDLTIGGPGKTSAVGWEHFVIDGTVGETFENLRGKHLIDVARAQGVTPEELVCDLLVRTRAQVCALVFQGYEANVRRVLHDEWATIGTDGILACGVPHPRAAGTFPRILRYAREGLLDLPRAIHMMSGRPAAVIGLRGRGTIRIGQAADIVVLDPVHVTDMASYTDTVAAPIGILHVLVNGVFVVRDAEITSRLPGRVLRRQNA